MCMSGGRRCAHSAGKKAGRQGARAQMAGRPGGAGCQSDGCFLSAAGGHKVSSERENWCVLEGSACLTLVRGGNSPTGKGGPCLCF